MKFFAVLIEIKDYPMAVPTLLQFKEDMKKHGGFVVFDLEQSNYDFLYNSLIEKANKELEHDKL
jgi:hypothetical protein